MTYDLLPPSGHALMAEPLSPDLDPVSADLTPTTKPAMHEVQDPIVASAVIHTHPERLARALAHARICARVAEDNRAKDIVLLDIRRATAIIDFFVIASAASRRQAYAIADEIDQEMKRRGERKLGIEGAEDARWILIDYGDFVVHIFSEDARTYYNLEEIWGDAESLSLTGDEAPVPNSVPTPDSIPDTPQA